MEFRKLDYIFFGLLITKIVLVYLGIDIFDMKYNGFGEVLGSSLVVVGLPWLLYRMFRKKQIKKHAIQHI